MVPIHSLARLTMPAQRLPGAIILGDQLRDGRRVRFA
jgi:hypothetical protein